MGTYKKNAVKFVHSLCLLDSYQFLSLESLESLAKTLSQTDFKHPKDGFSGFLDGLFGEITRCFFPYSYLKIFTKFQKLFPEVGESWRLWRNNLADKTDITIADYQLALDIYREFSRNNLGDYHDI